MIVNRFLKKTGKDPAGPHRYVIKKYPDQWYADAVNARLLL